MCLDNIVNPCLDKDYLYGYLMRLCLGLGVP